MKREHKSPFTREGIRETGGYNVAAWICAAEKGSREEGDEIRQENGVGESKRGRSSQKLRIRGSGIQYGTSSFHLYAAQRTLAQIYFVEEGNFKVASFKYVFLFICFTRLCHFDDAAKTVIRVRGLNFRLCWRGLLKRLDGTSSDQEKRPLKKKKERRVGRLGWSGWWKFWEHTIVAKVTQKGFLKNKIRRNKI